MKFVLKAIAVLLALFALLSVAMYLVEFQERGFTMWDALWYAAVTYTTIGYGDFFPTTTGGRLVALGIFVLSVATFSFLMTAINSAVSERRHQRELGMDGTKFTGHAVVCGWTRVGRVAFRELLAAGRHVAVICETADQLPLVRSMGDRRRIFVTRGDYTQEETLARVNIAAASTVVAASDHDADNLILSMQIRRLNPHARIVVSISRAELRDGLLSAGVTYVATPYETTGRLVASAAFEPDVAALIEDVTSSTDDETAGADAGYDLQELIVGGTSPLANRSVADAIAYLKHIHGPLLVAVAKVGEEGTYKVHPHPDEWLVITPRDALIVLGNDEQNARAAQALHVTQGR